MANVALMGNIPDKPLTKFLSSAIEICLKTLLTLSIASMIGIESTPFIAVLGASAVDFLVRAFVKTDDYWDFFFYARAMLKEAVESAEATIPFPQQYV